MWREDTMTNTKIVLAKIANCNRLKSFRTSAELILRTLELMVPAASTVAASQTYTDLFNFKGDHGEEFQDRTARSHAQTAVTGPRRACMAANRISDIR
jgi:hypothetical protein